MEASQSPSLADRARKLPARGAGRDRILRRLTHLHASAEAAGALQAAAMHLGEGAGAVAELLASSCAVWRGGRGDDWAFTDDPDAHDRLRQAVVSPEFVSKVPDWIRELREIASARPETGACTLATAFELWLWTMNHFRTGLGSRGEAGAQAFGDLADALCPLLAGRCLAMEIATQKPPSPADELEFRTDLCRVHAAHASALAGAACAELVFGYRRHLAWDAQGCTACYDADELDELEGWMPGITSGARANGDVVEADGTHPAKAGPCARFDGVDTFLRIRTRLDGCLTGARFARDRAAERLAGAAVSSTMPAKASEGSA